MLDESTHVGVGRRVDINRKRRQCLGTGCRNERVFDNGQILLGIRLLHLVFQKTQSTKCLFNLTLFGINLFRFCFVGDVLLHRLSNQLLIVGNPFLQLRQISLQGFFWFWLVVELTLLIFTLIKELLSVIKPLLNVINLSVDRFPPRMLWTVSFSHVDSSNLKILQSRLKRFNRAVI